MTGEDADRVVDHLFRRSAGQMVAALAHALGTARLDLAEEVVQDALLRALEVWRFGGIPANPQGWLYRVARNRALDVLRRDATLRARLASLPPPDAFDPPGPVEPLADHELALIFLCCHPALSADARVALTLKVAGGFSVDEIAAAFLADPAAIAQRIVRAKRTLRERGIDIGIPQAAEALQRLDSVLESIYLLFNEGYNAHAGNQLVREELCHEAIRLAGLLVRHPRLRAPRIHALLALMFLHASRLRARTHDDELVLLDAQDRTAWDASLIAEGMRHLSRAADGDELTAYHVEAAIAAAHVTAAPGRTDWRRILRLYDQLLLISPSPVVRLNRALALGKVRGAEAALDELRPLLELPAMRRYHLLPATMGVFLAELGRSTEAIAAWRQALRLPCNDAERRLLERRIAALQPGQQRRTS